MSAEAESDARLMAAGLAAAARTAGQAPSVHNTQPWRWRVHASTLELYADPRRQLAVTDPDERLLTLSCGAALHHAQVALAAEGWSARVERMPDPTDPRLLARLTATGRTPVTAAAMRLLQTVQIRRTDRRPVTTAEIPAAALDEIRRAAQDEGGRLQVLRPDDVLRLASAAARAQEAETLDPFWRDEVTYWAGTARPDGLGVPEEAIPVETPRTTVPGRDFGVAGTLPVSAEHDKAAVYAILYGDEDTPTAWLRAGEALSALWLVATEYDVSVLPLSAAVEVISTRHELRLILANLGEPYLVLRLGIADAEHAGPTRTPRLPADETVELIAP
jgi:nitroreductase